LSWFLWASIFIFLHVNNQFPQFIENTVLFQNACSYHPCWKSIDCRWVDLLTALCSVLFVYVCLHYTVNMLLWLL
jgi:hypothetical protein